MNPMKFNLTLVFSLIMILMAQVKKMKEMGDKFHLITPEPECTNVSFW